MLNFVPMSRATIVAIRLKLLLPLCLVAACVLFIPGARGAAAITLTQSASVDAGGTTSASLSFNTNNTAGNFIAVCIRAGRSGQVFTVKDSRGNTYRQAIQYNVAADQPNGDTMGIFYAENIAAGANTITVSDTVLQGTLRFAILEYSGVATANSLVVTAAAQGTSTLPNSGNATTTTNGDLVLGAIFTANTANWTAGGNFLIAESVPAEPNTKLIAEGWIQGTVGTISAGASLGTSDNWGAGMAAFKAAAAGGSSGPSITSLNPTSGVEGTLVTSAGANFGATQGTSTVKFNGMVAMPTSWSATSIAVPVPAGATTGNAVVTVGGVASNAVSFTVTSDTTPPVVTITAPANNAAVFGTITLTATATDPDGAVSFVQFLVDGANTGAQLTTAPYSVSLDTTTLSNASHTLTAIAKDPAGNQGTSVTVTITVSNTIHTSMGPLKHSTVNTRYFVNPAGNVVFLSGSQTWNDLQDTDTSGSSPAAFDFNAFVNFLKSHNHNATILWRKDLPQYCGWNFSGSVWKMGPWPWQRLGQGVATDGNPKFDLTQFNQPYFDRLRARVVQLQQNGIYAIVELFDANQLTSARCSTDGYAFSMANNVNGVDDGYTSGAGGTNSVTMSGPNAISGFQDTYVKKVLDTLNDLPNVIYEVAEEQPAGSATWWFPHVITLVHSYEATKPLQHPVGIGSMNSTAPNDATLYSSAADWVAPTINSNWANQFPSNVSTNNQGKVVINDSDHSLGYKSFLNSDGSIQDQNLRGYIWENITHGAEGVLFMEPYVIFWQGSPLRNTCLSPLHQVCTGGVDGKYENFRSSLGFAQAYVNAQMDLLKATPQSTLSSTGYCLADNVATGAEYLVYAPNGGTFTVNLGATTRALNVEWLNPATGAITSGAAISGGSTKTFTAPFTGDAVLYIVDAAGHN